MNSAAAKAPTLIVSRRALERLSNKYPQYLKPKVASSKNSKADDSPWPKSMQRVGYAAIAFAIPYSVSVIIAESPRLRADLEGDPGSEDGTPFSRRVVNFVRWYWGHADEIPYADYIEIEKSGEESKEISLESDISKFERDGQELIQKRIRKELKVKAETDGDGEERFGKIDGRIKSLDLAKVWNSIGMGTDSNPDLVPNQVYLTFDDDEDYSGAEEGENGNGMESEFVLGASGNTPVKELVNLTSIWSAWYHFAENSSATDPDNNSSLTSTKSRIDPYQNAIEELKLQLEDLEKDLKDPYCMKDTDDMKDEIKRVRKELGSLRNERRINKLKKFVSFSS